MFKELCYTIRTVGADAWLALRLALASFAGALRDVSLTLAPETHGFGCGKVRRCQTLASGVSDDFSSFSMKHRRWLEKVPSVLATSIVANSLTVYGHHCFLSQMNLTVRLAIGKKFLAHDIFSLLMLLVA